MEVAEHCGDKSASVEAALMSFERPFTIRDVEFKCPGVSRETIDSALKESVIS